MHASGRHVEVIPEDGPQAHGARLSGSRMSGCDPQTAHSSDMRGRQEYSITFSLVSTLAPSSRMLHEKLTNKMPARHNARFFGTM